MGLQYSIDVLVALKNAGYSQRFLIREKYLSNGTIYNLRQNHPVGWKNIEKICELLRCQPSDFLEWTPDD